MGGEKLTYDQAVQFVDDCEAAGRCYACGFHDGFHTRNCQSDEAVAQRGYRSATDLPGNPWHRMAITGLESELRFLSGVPPA